MDQELIWQNYLIHAFEIMRKSNQKKTRNKSFHLTFSDASPLQSRTVGTVH